MLNLFFLVLYGLFPNIKAAPGAAAFYTINRTSLTDSVPQASIFIHFDKEMYDPGETIWFKAYLFADFFPATTESEFTVKLLDEHGNVLVVNRYPVVNATAVGDIALGDSLLPGVYNLLATTSSTSAKEEVYSKDILIGYDPPTISADIAEPPLIMFYPEGGDFFDNQQTLAVIKVADKNGFPKLMRGQVVSESGVIQSEFESGKNGLARMSLTLSAKEKYYASLSFNGRKLEYPLPAARAGGLQLYLENEGDDKIIYLKNLSSEPLKDLLLRCTMNKQVVVESSVHLEKDGQSKVRIQPATLPSGVMVVSVYQKDKIIAQRKLMVGKPGSTPASITVKPVRSKKTTDATQLLVEGLLPGSYSVSVKNTDAGADFLKEDIYSRLLLFNNWKHESFQQNLFITNRMDSLQLDNLLLTTPFVDDSYTTKDVPPKEPYLSVTGTVHGKNKELITEGSIVFYVKPADTTDASFYTVDVTPNGTFKFDSLIFFGENRVYYNYLNASNREKDVIINFDKISPVDPSLFSFNAMNGSGDTSVKPLYNSFQVRKTDPRKISGLPRAKNELDTVHIRSRKQRMKDQMNDKYMAGSTFSRGGKIVLDNINDPYPNSSLNLKDYLLQSIRNLRLGVDDLQQPSFVNGRNFSLGSGRMWVVDLYVDNFRMDVLTAQTYRMNQVAFVKFYDGGSSGAGSSASGGVIAVYLKSHEESNPNKPSWISTKKYFDVDGYDEARDFEQQITGSGNSTLYWKPEVLVGDKSKIDVKFDKPASVKRMKVEIQGFDVNGRLVWWEGVVEN